MTRRRLMMLTVLALVVALAAAVSPTRAQSRTQIEFWYGLGQPLGGLIEKIVADFNASQAQYQVNPSFKGSYPETMVGAIAAFRAGNAPHIVQMFEVGTATMMAARGAVKPVHELMKETGVPFDPNAYVPAVKGYYSLPDGRMVAMPFNSSTTIMFYNKDAFKKAGLDPAKPPQTWPDLVAAAKKIKAANAAPCAFTTAWPTWAQFEQFSAIHDVPLATKANGMAGLDAELKINSPLHVKHVQNLLDMQKEGTFKYGGRDAAGDALFPSGECAMIHASSGLRARIMREAKFEWGPAMLPYWPGTPNAPKNSIIGGAAFWVMTSPTRKPEEYKGVAEFFRFISQPDVVAKWHTDTGFLPVTVAGYEKVKASGFYQQNPGTDIPYLQLTRTQPSENSRGLRLGNMPEIRNIIQEELEKAFQGQQTAQQALDNAVQRGNVVLRNFERANRS
ncbi:MAG TPA: sn-glycerol-3-phosphate ABC transporter substrate-binding protein UgpB [Methylomirabilota bacterium]|nr:sn-glycerol-3-phosphate ABC transporter substrate-binding protein UgpB [Methylomirabilota bacterium]